MSNEKEYKGASELIEKWTATDCKNPGIQLTRGALVNLEIKIASALATVRKEEREAAEKVGRQALAAELLGHLDRITSTTAAFHFVRNTCKIE